uniref:Uncharacterized protein n=1 Tax=Rhizophora mucronata TaxID=61149 RepID=A0A2P2NM59_RHIMU
MTQGNIPIRHWCRCPRRSIMDSIDSHTFNRVKQRTVINRTSPGHVCVRLLNMHKTAILILFIVKHLRCAE